MYSWTKLQTTIILILLNLILMQISKDLIGPLISAIANDTMIIVNTLGPEILIRMLRHELMRNLLRGLYERA